MKAIRVYERITNAFLFGVLVLLAGCQLAAADNGIGSQQQDAGQAQLSSTSGVSDAAGRPQTRRAPEARTSGTLGPIVMRAITEIQSALGPEQDGAEPDLQLAKQLLDELYETRFERMNDFEKQTTLNFYTNYYLMQNDFGQARRTFEELLSIETLRADIRLRTLKSLGQLYAAEESWEDSIDSYSTWQNLSESEDDVVYRGLSYAHYQLEQWMEALELWQSYMRLKQESNEELNRDDYAYLNGLYFTLEDYESALGNTREMILLFNNERDWENLRAIFRELDKQSEAGIDEGSGSADVASWQALQISGETTLLSGGG